MSVDSSLSASAPPANNGGAATEPAPSPTPAVRIHSVAVWGLFVLATLYTIHFAKPILMPVVAAMIIAQRLTVHPTDPRRQLAILTVINRRKRQKTPSLVRI